MQTRFVDFVYIKLPRRQRSPTQEHDVHAALESALAEHRLGTLIGWGASVEHGPGGNKSLPEFHRVDIEVSDLRAALPVLRATLVTLPTPYRSELHYTIGGEALQEEYGPNGWGASHPTTATTRRRTRPRNEP